jgi:dienelactone hydrolase
MKPANRAILWFAMLSASLACLAAPLLPEPDGEYAVGMRRFELTDEARRGVMANDPNEPRVIPGYVWYPAIEGTHGTRPYLTPAEIADQGRAMARNFGYGTAELDGLSSVMAHSVEGAPPAQGHAFPVLIFSHGYECYPAQNTALLEQLASHGYVVFSIAHPHDAADLRSSTGTLLPTIRADKRDPLFASVRRTLTGGADHDARTVALRDYAEALSRDRIGTSFAAWRDDTLFAVRAIEGGRVPLTLTSVLKAADTQRLGLVGMSFGGATAAASCRLIPQCRAAINLDGGNYDPALFNASVERPLLLMMSDWVNLPTPGRAADPAFHHNDYAYEPWLRAGLDPNVVRLRLEGIRHMGYTDLILLMDGPEHAARFGTVEPRMAVDTIANVSLAFLNRYLKQGNPTALDDIVRRTPALRPHAPDSVREWAMSRQ